VSASTSLKAEAARTAVEREVRSGMRLGFGTGSTAMLMLDELAARLADGRLADIVGVPTSQATAVHCRELGIPLAALDQLSILDLAIDGADEIDPELRLIKGGGGAHLREKVVAYASRRMAVIADESKLVSRLGQTAPLPVEVIRFATPVCERLLRERGWEPRLRMRSGNADPFVTDEGNWILDCSRDDWDDPEALDRAVDQIPGVVAHGLFMGVAAIAYVATAEGVRVLQPAAGAP
jgi:ribose 5-phosphate isomerase A